MFYFYAKYVTSIQALTHIVETCLLLLRKMYDLRSFGANYAILKHLRSFVANWRMSRFTLFLRKIFPAKTAVA